MAARWRTSILISVVMVPLGILVANISYFTLFLTLVVACAVCASFFVFLALFARKIQPPVPPILDDNPSIVFRSNIMKALQQEASLIISSSSAAGTQSEPKDAIHCALEALVDLLCQDYVDYWYAGISDNDPRLGAVSKEAIWFMLKKLAALLKQVDFLKLLAKDIVAALRDHFRSVRLNPGNFPSHPCLASPESELLYLRQVSEVIIQHLLPEKESRCTAVSVFLREVLACQVLKYCVDRFSDPDYINQYIIYRCDLAADATPAAERAYAYARDYAGFLKVINECEDAVRLKDIRYHIITEIIQAEHVNHVKREARAGSGARSALAMVSDTDKGANLTGRDLGRYINQLRHAKSLAERRIILLGGPDLRGAAVERENRELVRMHSVSASPLPVLISFIVAHFTSKLFPPF
jgi:hypothetical protein